MNKNPQEDKQLESTLVKYDPKELRRLSKLKLSKTKQNKFVDLYSQFPNMAKCAKSVGISLRTVYSTMERDSDFKELIMECRANIGESLKEAMVQVGSIPDARGANDRRNYLQAYDDDFKQKPDTAIQVNITSENAHIELKNLLDKPVTKPINAEFTVIEEEQST